MIDIESDLDALWNALEQSHDFALLAMLSDEYLSQGDDVKAECLRWCMVKGRKPGTWNDEKTDRIWFGKQFDREGQPCFIPDSLDWKLQQFCLKGVMDWQNGSPTITRAYLFLCEGWQLLTEKQRKESWQWNP